jgi:hypothetical protein
MSLARHVLDFTRVLSEVEATLLPSRTCDYVYEFAKLFSKFYQVCNVGQAEPALKVRSPPHARSSGTRLIWLRFAASLALCRGIFV